jgi:thioredoxin-dependent peroxiredoxin
MQIQTGKTAPSFVVQDIFGNELALENYRGKKLWLQFFRNSACAICNLRVHQLSQLYPTWQKQGVEVIAVFESPLENIRRYVGRQHLPFPIVADPDGELYRLYDVEVSSEKVAKTMAMSETPQIIAEAQDAGFALTKEEGSNFNRIPAEFLINPDLTVYHAHYGQYIYDHLPFEAVDEFVESRQLSSLSSGR